LVRVVVIGGGVSGSAAAITAAKAGAEVILLERTDLLLGAAQVGGYISTKVGGAFCVAEEARALGAGEMMDELENLTSDRLTTDHSLSDLDKLKWTAQPRLYDCGRAEPAMRRLVESMGVQIHFESRATDVRKEGNRITAVKLAKGEWVTADAFVDCTGTSGGMSNCVRYGKGCAMCPFFRCPTFGDRVSIAGKAGVPEMNKQRPDGSPGLISTAMHYFKDSLSSELQEALNKAGRAVIDIGPVIDQGIIDPKEYKDIYHSMWARWGFDPETDEPLDPTTSVKGFTRRRDMVFADRGIPGLVTNGNFPYLPYEKIRQIPGLENAVVAFPQGGRTNLVFQLGVASREDSLRAKGLENLFVAGEKAAVMQIVGCMASGLLAGHNAVRAAVGKELVVLPPSTVTGDYHAFCYENMHTDDGRQTYHVLTSGVYLSRIVKRGLCHTDAEKVRDNIKDAGLTGVYARKLI
jgi:hypothetical protein